MITSVALACFALLWSGQEAESAADLELPTADNFLDSDPQEEEDEPGVLEEVGMTLWGLGKIFVLDMGYLVTAPLRPTKDGVFIFAGGVALLGVTMAVLDEPIRGFAQRNRHENLDQTLGIVRQATTKPQVLGLGLASVGLLLGDHHLERTGLEVMETEFVVGRLTSFGKRLFGRSRPYMERGSSSFKFWGGSEEGRRSLPSGGAANAWAIAVPIAEEYPGTVWPYLVYSVAVLSSVERIVQDAHWTSDVLASALLSIAVGKALVWLHRQDESPTLVPWLAGESGDRVWGLAFERSF